MIPNFLNPAAWSPPRILASGFALIILLGGLLLSQPVASNYGTSLSFIDGLFTATSATCVTGLVVVDTGTYFSLLGQLTILLLIQVGGLGFMTMATLFALVLRKRITLRERIILQESMNQQSMHGIVRLIRRVFLYSITIEAAGALLLTIRWAFDFPLGKAVYFGIFHAVSLFNSAGFDLFGEYRSLTSYVEDPFVNIVSMALIVMGGLGFVVIVELLEYKKTNRLSLHAKVVLTITGYLVFLGALVFYILEFTNTLEPLSWSGKVLASFFQSITPRSAGVNTVAISDLRQATQFFLMIFMFIGAAPGSTGGGIKITTAVVLFAGVYTMIRGREDIVIFKYRLASDRILKALTISMLALGMVIVVTMILSTSEKHNLIQILFETVSAVGTVGLSTGITPELSGIGKLLITVSMFAGRLGPLTLAYALRPQSEKPLHRHPEGRLIIG